MRNCSAAKGRKWSSAPYAHLAPAAPRVTPGLGWDGERWPSAAGVPLRFRSGNRGRHDAARRGEHRRLRPPQPPPARRGRARAAVAETRRRLAAALGVDKLTVADQKHTARVVVVDERVAGRGHDGVADAAAAFPATDAMIT